METGHLPFRSAAVLGAGVMGAQIAAHLANAGLEVLLLDIPAKEGPKNAVVQKAFINISKLKPAPFASKAAAERITLGNFEDDLNKLDSVEWVIEVVIEHLPIKKNLMAKVEQVVGKNTIISTNTSGLPIHKIAEGRSASFKKRFLGTHFFNPPRYLKLLELIPLAETDPDIVDRLRWYGRVHLGKGVVTAKDTPNFIANRIGVYATLQAIKAYTDSDFTIEEVDAMTGPVIGHAKSATFRTADVVGLDTLHYVSQNLYDALPDEENREKLKAPAILEKLVNAGRLGQKSREGFYKKVGKEIFSLNNSTFDYDAQQPLNLGDMDAVWKAGGLARRIMALYSDTGRAGTFTRESLLDLFGYCVRRIPDIADRPSDIDRAIRWGFMWELGPFETWDVLGFKRVLSDMAEAGIAIPEWVKEMSETGATAFYTERNGVKQAYAPGRGYITEPTYTDEISVATITSDRSKVLFERKEAALLDLGDGVALYEFRSKANTLGSDVVEGLLEAISHVEKGAFQGLVIGNEGKNFSVGANLGEAAFVLQQGRLDLLEMAVKRFQDMVNGIRYARKPVVTALHNLALGGACEMAMASANVIAPLETYIGLVELGAGLIPAGCGTTYMVAQAAAQAANEHPSQVQNFIAKAFETIATARVATSAYEAIELGYLPSATRVVMNSDRRIHVAKAEVLRLASQGYAPPPVRSQIYVLGADGRAALETAAYMMNQAGYATDYDRYLANRLAWIMTGGDLTVPSKVHEDYLYGLEREVFLELLKQKKTQARVESILKTNKPLRN